MKKFIPLFLYSLFLFHSCDKKTTTNKTKEVVRKDFQTILNNTNVNGTILIFDTKKNTYYSNNFKEANVPYLPASTFKIPNSIIGLETGILKNEKSVFKWRGEKRAFTIWEKDLTLKEAFQTSCVPCYKKLARKIGVERMNNALEKLRFGKMDVNKNTIDNFWLTGNSKITPFEQIDFLQRLYHQKLPLKKSTFKTISSILKMETKSYYTISGKTGLAITEATEIGWFVGYLEIDKNVVYFATKIKNSNALPRNTFLKVRKQVTNSAIKNLKII